MTKFIDNVDLTQRELQNVVIHPLASAPGSPVNGQAWYDSANGVGMMRAGGANIVAAGRLDQLTAPSASVNLASQRIVSLGDPTGAQDAATKAYVDSLTTGAGTWKAPVRAAQTTNVTLAGGAPSTVDGVALAAADRVLVTGQTTASQNGIYVVQTLGTGANGTWVRATDADSSAELAAGANVIVQEGTGNADTWWILTTNAPITLNTTALTFSKVNFASGSGVAAFAATGPGSTGTTWAVAHNLGSQDVTWSLREVATQEYVFTKAVATDGNTLTFTFGSSVTLNTLRAVVHK